MLEQIDGTYLYITPGRHSCGLFDAVCAELLQLFKMGLIFHSLGVLAFVILAICQFVLAAGEYDYIVIGSGPGGGPLAANLARANYSVLLLEGGDQSTGNSGGQYPPQITWDFFVKHYDDEERTLKHNLLTWRLTDGNYWVGNKNVPTGAKLLGVYYPRGGTVGGSSMINAMVTFLPSASDWNYIADITGDKTWRFAPSILFGSPVNMY